MRVLTINGKYMKSKEAMYIHLTRVFSFPSYFGNNLDALWDLLNEVDEPTVIEFKNVDLALENLEDYGKRLLQVFKRLEEQNKYYRIYYVNE